MIQKCKKTNIDIRIVVRNAHQLRYNPFVDGVVNNLLGVLSRKVCPYSVSLSSIPSDGYKSDSVDFRGAVLETKLSEMAVEMSEDIVAAIQSTLKYSDVTVTAQLFVDGIERDVSRPNLSEVIAE